jgi:hypothetical protein
MQRIGCKASLWAASGLLVGGAACAADSAPDIQGIWTSGTLTPFERPAQLPQGVPDEQQRVAAEKFWAAGHKPDDVGRDNDAFIDQHLAILPNGQTSLIVEPADGKVPFRPEALSRRDFNLSSFDSYETMSQWDRCITREPTTMFPVVYNNAYQFVQTPGYVLIVAEMVHDARVIPINNDARAAHADSRVRSWAGDARGHWEGKTLVVDTTNFNGLGYIATGGNAVPLKGTPTSEQLHVVERFTRIDHDTMQYEITIDDPTNYTAPWKVAYPLARDDKYQMFEYACHEGNRAIELILGGARAQERVTTR